MLRSYYIEYLRSSYNYFPHEISSNLTLFKSSTIGRSKTSHQKAWHWYYSSISLQPYVRVLLRIESTAIWDSGMQCSKGWILYSPAQLNITSRSTELWPLPSKNKPERYTRHRSLPLPRWNSKKRKYMEWKWKMSIFGLLAWIYCSFPGWWYTHTLDGLWVGQGGARSKRQVIWFVRVIGDVASLS